jgi:hypothetical protein
MVAKKVGRFVIPVLFGVYPVLAMFSFNTGEIDASQTSRAFLFSFVFAAGLTLLLLAILHDQLKSSLIASEWLIVIFAYGHIYALLHKSLGAQIGRHLILLPLAVFAMVAWALWVRRTSKSLKTIYTFASLMIGTLMVMVSFSLAQYYIPLFIAASQRTVPMSVSTSAATGEKPDIYYIILDGHGRQDILQELYKYDDSEFTSFLVRQGFYVADSSCSNYIQTMLSLSSSLNMQYLDTIGLPTKDAHDGRIWLDTKITHSLVRELLAEQGYQMVTFSNGFPTIPDDADIYFDFDSTKRASEINEMQGLNEFERLLLSATIGRVIVDEGWIPNSLMPKQDLNGYRQYLHHYEQVRFTIDKLAEVPKLPGDYFVFAHIVAPHPPFVFGANGEFMVADQPYSIGDGPQFEGTPDEYISGYRDQAIFIDHAIQNLITKILVTSNPPPIIIIQGDHGPGAFLDWESMEKTNLEERFSILNAYYFPGDPSHQLYESITPVNSFRILFDNYFGTKYELLDDRSFYSTWSQPFKFVDVTGMLKKR